MHSPIEVAKPDIIAAVQFRNRLVYFEDDHLLLEHRLYSKAFLELLITIRLNGSHFDSRPVNMIGVQVWCMSDLGKLFSDVPSSDNPLL